MSTKSKTGAKLVSSVKKSKTGAVARKTSQRPDVEKPETKSKAPAARSTTKVATKATTKKPASKTSTNQGRKDVFSHGRRVWPD